MSDKPPLDYGRPAPRQRWRKLLLPLVVLDVVVVLTLACCYWFKIGPWHPHIDWDSPAHRLPLPALYAPMPGRTRPS